MDVDLEHVPSQMGTAVVDLATGNVIKSSGDLSGEDGQAQCQKLLQLMKVRMFLLIMKFIKSTMLRME